MDNILLNIWRWCVCMSGNCEQHTKFNIAETFYLYRIRKVWKRSQSGLRKWRKKILQECGWQHSYGGLSCLSLFSVHYVYFDVCNWCQKMFLSIKIAKEKAKKNNENTSQSYSIQYYSWRWPMLQNQTTFYFTWYSVALFFFSFSKI